LSQRLIGLILAIGLLLMALKFIGLKVKGKTWLRGGLFLVSWPVRLFKGLGGQIISRQSEINCPHCDQPVDLIRAGACLGCGFREEKHIWAGCGNCGQTSEFFNCPDCGLSVRRPWWS